MSEKEVKHGASVEEPENTEALTQANSSDGKKSVDGGDTNLEFITSSGHRHHRHRSESSKKRRKKRKRKKLFKKVLITLGIVLLSLAVITASAIFVLYHSGKNEMKTNNAKIETPKDVQSVGDGQYIYYNGEKYRYKNDIINMLFIGVDENNGKGASGEIGDNGQSDVIALGAIDSKSNKVTLINVPRDIMTDVKVYSTAGGYSGTEKMQIALSYAYGDGGDTSCINTMSAVRTLFYNVPISSYFALQMRGIPDVNDSIGGVTVKSPSTIYTFEKGKTYHLMGEDALLFVSKRDMDSADANLQRNERQKVYLNSFMKEFIKQTRSDFGTPIRVFNASKPYSYTNLNANRITYLATEFILNRNMKIVTKNVPVTVKQNGDRAENYVKEKEFYDLFLSVFYEKVKE